MYFIKVKKKKHPVAYVKLMYKVLSCHFLEIVAGYTGQRNTCSREAWLEKCAQPQILYVMQQGGLFVNT